MGLFGKPTSKPAKMRTLRVELKPKKKAAKGANKAAKVMSFAQWVDDYVKMSKGNPV